MDNSGTVGTNMDNTKQPTSPFAPVDIPDINNISAPSAMPPMGMPMPPASNVTQAGDAMQAAQSAQPMQAVVAETSNGASQATQPANEMASITMADIPEPAVQPEKPEEEKKPETKKPEPKRTLAEAEVAKAVKEDTAKTETVLQEEERVAGVMSAPVVDVANTGAGSVTIEPLLEECIRQNASDLHLQVGLPPILRVDGALRPITTYSILDNETVQRLVFSTLDANQKMILIKDKEFDYSFAFGDLGRFRVNAFHEKGNMAAAFRLIPNVIKTIEELGIPGVVAGFADHPNGLVLVTGPTGSGKSTTLAALIDKINTEKAEHIITIEDPIEFTHQSKRSVVAQREVHYDTFSFAAALRSILREDPDVVLIGEMRDLETIQAAITVAETGHLVFATLHTNSAAQSIDRMIDVFPAHQQPQIRAQLANILVGICSQRLVPAIDGGRIAVTEIMVTNSAVRSIIREGKTHQLDMTIQTGMSQGMQTMDRELAKFVKSGVISYDVAREYTVDPAEFDRLARG